MLKETELISCTDVAQRIGRDKATVRAWCRTGSLPAFKVGKDWLVREEDLHEYMSRRGLEAAPDGA